jgi:3alpha(or 20beta)-hydroxysteroid dehydrogenase
MPRLEGKVALITGAAGGQGAAEARMFAAEGAAVVIADLLDEQGQMLCDELRAEGLAASYRHLDVSDEDSWSAVVDGIEAEHGRLDVLVNNAGIGDRRGVVEQPLRSFNKVIDVNVWGPVVGMRACAPVMARGGGGSIVNISSIAGLTGYDAAAYTASKWALRGVTKLASLEYADDGIRVNSVHPGTIITPMIADVSQADLDNYVRVTPMRRAGFSDEIATAVLYLASDEASFVTGAELVVDGGFVAGGANMSLALRVQKMKETARA